MTVTYQLQNRKTYGTSFQSRDDLLHVIRKELYKQQTYSNDNDTKLLTHRREESDT